MIERDVAYLSVGTKMSVMLAVSIRSLRHWWGGHISIFTERTATPITERIAATCDADVIPFAPPRQKRHSHYAAKPHLPGLFALQSRQTVYLDADTLVVNSFDELWPEHDSQWVLTQFSGWTSNGKHVSGRIKKWKPFCPDLVKKQLQVPLPAVNTGVFAVGCTCSLATKHWPALNDLNAGAFMSDELSAQLIYPEHWGWKLLDDRFNCSPAFGTEQGRADVRIWHFHGRKAVKKESYRRLWWPEFRAAWLEDYAGMQTWCPAGDKRLTEFLNVNPRAIEENVLVDGSPVAQDIYSCSANTSGS